MNFIILLIVGGVIGWLASLIMRTDAQQGILLNIVVGIVGSLLAGLLLSPLLGVAPITSGGLSIPTLLPAAQAKCSRRPVIRRRRVSQPMTRRALSNPPRARPS